MRVEQLNEEMWAMTYLVVCDDTNKATLIDPVWDNLGDYLSLLEEAISRMIMVHSIKPNSFFKKRLFLHYNRATMSDQSQYK